MIRNSIFAAVVLATPVSAFAQASDVQLKGDVKVEKVVVENGVSRKVLSPPKAVVPGDRLSFTTSYVNTGKQPVTDFVITNPLPAPVRLAPEGADSLTVSVDGGKTWGRLATLRVPDGKGGMRPATASDATHIRWTVARIAPGGGGSVSYQGIVR